MKHIAVVLIGCILIGCVSLGEYPLASRKILELTPEDEEFNPRYPDRLAFFCWAKVDEAGDVGDECEADSGLTEAALSACVSELSALELPSKVESKARQDILRCMERSGWRRLLIEVLS